MQNITKGTPGHNAKITARQEPADKSTWQKPYLWLGLHHRSQDERFLRAGIPRGLFLNTLS